MSGAQLSRIYIIAYEVYIVRNHMSYFDIYAYASPIFGDLSK